MSTIHDNFRLLTREEAEKGSVEFKPFIYGLSDPVDPGHIRYIGMAQVRASRPFDHVKVAHRNFKKPTHHMNWIRKLLHENRMYLVFIIEELAENTKRSLTSFVERCYIKSLRELGHNLTNVHNGGQGRANIGQVVTEETRAIMSASAKGRTKSEVTKERMSLTRENAWKNGMYDSPETRAGYSKPRTEDWNEKNRQAHLGNTASEETKADMSVSQKARYQDAAELKKTSDASKAAWARKHAKDAAWAAASSKDRSLKFAEWEKIYDIPFNLEAEERRRQARKDRKAKKKN